MSHVLAILFITTVVVFVQVLKPTAEADNVLSFSDDDDDDNDDDDGDGEAADDKSKSVTVFLTPNLQTLCHHFF